MAGVAPRSCAARAAEGTGGAPVRSAVRRRGGGAQMSPLEASTAHAEGKEAALKALGAKFGMYHGLSSLANLVVFGCAVAHGWWAVGRALV